MAGKIGKIGKQKNKSAAKKRIARTGSGKWKIQKPGRNHLLLQKSKRQKKLADKPHVLGASNKKAVKKLLPSF